MDDVGERLRDAIRRRRWVSFFYVKPGKTPGQRVGAPYVLFETSGGLLQCLIFQTEGATDSVEAVPGWRQFQVQYVQGLSLLEDRDPFAVRRDFKRDDPRYARALESVAL